MSDQMDKTIVVRVERLVQDPRYKKYMRKTRKIHVHDSSNECGKGDMVRVVETRPLSKTKRWRIDEILKRAE